MDLAPQTPITPHPRLQTADHTAPRPQTPQAPGSIPARTRRRRLAALAPVAIAGLIVAGLPLSTGTAAAAQPSVCLWAGQAFAPDAAISAGGTNYRCGTQAGQPYWFPTGPTANASTVANPGADSDPAGRFSAGARQPGTTYTDRCVGTQLIDGAADIQQVVATKNGTLVWKPTESISQWNFGTDPRPAPTYRADSSCISGALA
ncbi:hypothetical protein JK358_33350 [Nocardia sp. 2]|uniref:Secreted protein n=1 Tax=Nocardia acididurans TaxID=2802282 RepID=A0ABS1MF77_9NOCA|nr:hypothetical protein [Nocardia acididurans]MBL1079303.1 hypothetical protein [Nocardia acididurans]